MQTLVNKVSNMINSWTSKPMSQEGRFVMMKSILFAIPIYLMSCCKLPYGIIAKIPSIITKFWHGSNMGEILWGLWPLLKIRVDLVCEIWNGLIKRFSPKMGGIWSLLLMLSGLKCSKLNTFHVLHFLLLLNLKNASYLCSGLLWGKNYSNRVWDRMLTCGLRTGYHQLSTLLILDIYGLTSLWTSS